MFGALMILHACPCSGLANVLTHAWLLCRQGEVYDLVAEDGRPLDLVLKTLPHGKLSAVTGVLASMEREWAVGHRLAMHCTTPAGNLHSGVDGRMMWGASCSPCAADLQALILASCELEPLSLCRGQRKVPASPRGASSAAW